MLENGVLKPDGVIQLKGGTASVLMAENPLLAQRELCVEIDTRKIKVGDGINYWNDLPYVGDASETWTFELEDGTIVTREVSSWTSGA